MRSVRILVVVAALCGLGVGAPAAWADNRDAGGSWCDQNRDKCANLKAKRDQYCHKNPQACENPDPRRDARRDDCNSRDGCSPGHGNGRQHRDD
jgi:hypothetical protein